MDGAWALFTTVAVAHGLAVASPGPDFAIVTRQTLINGRRAGLWTSLGIGTGILFHVAYALFGLGWITERWPLFLEILRYAGAAFLIYLGWGALQAQPLLRGGDAAAPPADATSAGKLFGIGVLTNVLNPKAVLFFVALCSAVITTATPIALRFALGLWLVLATTAWFSFVSLTLGHSRVREQLLGKAHWIDRAMGVVLIGLGVLMLVT